MIESQRPLINRSLLLSIRGLLQFAQQFRVSEDPHNFFFNFESERTLVNLSQTYNHKTLAIKSRGVSLIFFYF
jgi:hypothetical protein